METAKRELEVQGYRLVKDTPEHVIGIRKKWHWDCFLTKLTTIVSLRRVQRLTTEMIAGEGDALKEEWKSLDNSLLPRGFQKGVALLPVFLADEIDDDAGKVCTSKPKIRFAYFFQPACKEVASGTAYFLTKAPAWGGIYYGKFRFLWKRLLTPERAASREPVSVFGIVFLFLILGLAVLWVIR